MVRVATAALVHLTLITAALVYLTSPAADSGAFVGNVMVEWLDQNNPAVTEIEQRIDAATKRPGPHIFAQGH